MIFSALYNALVKRIADIETSLLSQHIQFFANISDFFFCMGFDQDADHANCIDTRSDCSAPAFFFIDEDQTSAFFQGKSQAFCFSTIQVAKESIDQGLIFDSGPQNPIGAFDFLCARPGFSIGVEFIPDSIGMCTFP